MLLRAQSLSRVRIGRCVYCRKPGGFKLHHLHFKDKGRITLRMSCNHCSGNWIEVHLAENYVLENNEKLPKIRKGADYLDSLQNAPSCPQCLGTQVTAPWVGEDRKIRIQCQATGCRARIRILHDLVRVHLQVGTQGTLL